MGYNIENKVYFFIKIARLESVCGLIAHRGFESRPLRQDSKKRLSGRFFTFWNPLLCDLGYGIFYRQMLKCGTSLRGLIGDSDVPAAFDAFQKSDPGDSGRHGRRLPVRAGRAGRLAEDPDRAADLPDGVPDDGQPEAGQGAGRR